VPRTDVVYYAEADGTSPVIDWFDEIPANAQDKLLYRVLRLEAAGHELRRPEADVLRDGIYELRVRRQRVNYRLLYFFYQGLAVLAHGCTKEGAVDRANIERAIARRKQYVHSPAAHTFVQPDADEPIA
jgi:phage-related protein